MLLFVVSFGSGGSLKETIPSSDIGSDWGWVKVQGQVRGEKLSYKVGTGQVNKNFVLIFQWRLKVQLVIYEVKNGNLEGPYLILVRKTRRLSISLISVVWKRVVLCSKPFPRIQRKGEISLTVADFQNYKVQVKFNLFYKITPILFHIFWIQSATKWANTSWGKSRQCYVFKFPWVVLKGRSQFFLASVSICLTGALGGFILHDNSPQ